MTSVIIANVILWSDFLPNVTVKHPNKQTLYWTWGGGALRDTVYSGVPDPLHPGFNNRRIKTDNPRRDEERRIQGGARGGSAPLRTNEIFGFQVPTGAVKKV